MTSQSKYRNYLIWISIFLLALVIYLGSAALDAWFQACDAPRSQVYRIPLSDSNAVLYIQSPRSLSFDGPRQQGRIELTIRPLDLTDASPGLPTDQLLPPSGSSLIRLRRFLGSCWDEMAATSVSPLPTPAATPSLDGNEAEQIQSGSEGQEWSFQISSSEGILLISSDGISYAPLITLSLSADVTVASFLVEHAALAATPHNASIFLQNLSGQQLPMNVATIELESQGDLYLRKFFGVALSLGSVFALIATGFAYLIQQRTEQKERDERARAEQRERDERERKERELQLIFDRVQSARPGEIPERISDWVRYVDSLPEPPLNLPNQVRILRETIQKLARNDVMALGDSSTSWVSELHGVVQRLEEILDPEDVALINDLHFVVRALGASGATFKEDSNHSFTDAYLLGVYLNYTWAGLSKDTRQMFFDRLEGLTGQEIATRNIVMYDALWGVYACDEQMALLKDRSSLRKELGDWYSCLDIPAEERSVADIPPPGDRLFAEVIARIAGGNDPTVIAGLQGWCQNTQTGREHRRDRSREQLRIRWPLWPVSGAEPGAGVEDANYDYQLPDEPDESATKEPPYWEDIFAELNQPHHHYVQGGKGSGKSWLRIYFENIVWSEHVRFLPVFYFPPLELFYDVEDRGFLYRSIASSVGNCLAAALLESHTFAEREIQQIAPFLARYGYAVPLGEACLASPTSPVADLDGFYANRVQSYRLARIREAARRARERQPHTNQHSADQILRGVHAAVDAVGFSRVYLLIDNLPPNQERRIWPTLRSVSVGAELDSHSIYLKMFGVASGPAEGWPNPITQAGLRVFRQQPPIALLAPS